MGNQIIKSKTEVPPVKCSVSPVKYVPNEEVVLVFVEKSGSRFITRIKIDEVLFNYLSEIDISLPFLIQINLQQNLKEIFGYFFYTSVFILLFQIII
jgi:hypothetical protein